MSENVYSYEFFSITPVFYIFLLLFIIGVYFLLNLNNPYVKNKIVHLLITIILLSVSGLILITILQDSIVMYREVFISYQNNEYTSIEGEVRNFDPASFEPIASLGSDTFTVNDIRFSVGNAELAGLRKNAANGGPICEEGQRIIIGYITVANVNYIVRVDIFVNE